MSPPPTEPMPSGHRPSTRERRSCDGPLNSWRSASAREPGDSHSATSWSSGGATGTPHSHVAPFSCLKYPPALLACNLIEEGAVPVNAGIDNLRRERVGTHSQFLFGFKYKSRDRVEPFIWPGSIRQSSRSGNESFLTYFRFLSSHTTVRAVRHTAV